MSNLLVASLLIFFPLISQAAEVVKVKGRSALVELKGDPAVVGDVFYLISPDGKRRAIMTISKVKGDKAIGKITKGKAQVGYTLEFRPAKGSSASARASSPSTSSSGGGLQRSYWGALLGYSMDTMSVNVKNALQASVGTANMSGSGFSVKGLFDYELFPQIWFRGTAGVDMFNAAGGKICGAANTDACDAKLTYVTADFIARYVFGRGGFRPWVGGGLGLLFPASKETTALDSASISTTNVMLALGGLDWQLSPRMYVPISVEYGLLPKSDEVEANWIAIRVGIAMPM